jgi:hypothetical protein
MSTPRTPQSSVEMIRGHKREQDGSPGCGDASSPAITQFPVPGAALHFLVSAELVMGKDDETKCVLVVLYLYVKSPVQFTRHTSS